MNLIKEKIIRLYIKKLFESKFFAMNQGDLNANNISNFFNSRLKFINISNLNDLKDYLIDIAGPDIFISFTSQWDENIPTFSINPMAKYNTPHGIYFYPFDKKNAIRFIKDGKPTIANFAIRSEYFHLVQVDLTHPNVLIINEDGTTNKPDLTSFEFNNNLNEIIRIFFEFSNILIQKNEIFLELIENHKNYNNGYIKLYQICSIISKKIKSNNNSELFGLLLNSLQIKCVIDKGLGIIHHNEPMQMHILQYDDNETFYKYIGTFKNLIKDYIYVEDKGIAPPKKENQKINSLLKQKSLSINDIMNDPNLKINN
jgi:hypothetical protein